MFISLSVTREEVEVGTGDPLRRPIPGSRGDVYSDPEGHRTDKVRIFSGSRQNK